MTEDDTYETCHCNQDLAESGDCASCGYAPETCIVCVGQNILFNHINQILSRTTCRSCEGGGYDSDWCEACEEAREAIISILDKD